MWLCCRMKNEISGMNGLEMAQGGTPSRNFLYHHLTEYLHVHTHYFIYFISKIISPRVHISDGSTDYDAHVWIILSNLICERHFMQTRMQVSII